MNFVLGRSGDSNGIILIDTDISKCCTFLLLLAPDAGVFRGACLSSLDERRAPLKKCLRGRPFSYRFFEILICFIPSAWAHYLLIIDGLYLLLPRSHQVVRDFDLFRLLGALVFVDALLLVIWMTLHPPSRNVIIQTEGTRSVRLGSTIKWFNILYLAMVEVNRKRRVNSSWRWEVCSWSIDN